jgi:DMSO/TMAO reductase YedYZ heme-binding membrane subunit
MSNELFWYSARAGGIVAWALLSASVIWGLFISTRALGRRPRRPWLLDLHRYLGGLALVFTAVHVVTLMLDTFIHFGLTEVLVPLASSFRPVQVALGIVGLYLLVAIELTSLVRDRLPRRLWHRIHLLSFPVFVLTTIHLFTAGTDAGNTLLRLAAVLVSAAVVGLTIVRVSAETSPRRSAPSGAKMPAWQTTSPSSTPMPLTPPQEPSVVYVPNR